MSHLKKPIKITVCADGFVSVMSEPKHRRQRAALPCYSVDTFDRALALIDRVCKLKACFHGGKTGMTLEPHAPNWHGEAGLEAVSELTEIFKDADLWLESEGKG